MKKCSVFYILLCSIAVFMTSCTSIKGLLNPDYTVSYGESVQTVKERVAKIEKSNTYMKKFTTKDKMGNTHQVIIYDKQYIKVDKVIYAYKFDALMYYQLVLNVLGSVQTVSGMVPYWGLKKEPYEGAKELIPIERLVYEYPFSIDAELYVRLMKVLSLYRMTLGQTRQEELVNYLLNEKIDGVEELFINLCPKIKL